MHIDLFNEGFGFVRSKGSPNRKDTLSGARLDEFDRVLHLLLSVRVRELRRMNMIQRTIVGETSCVK